MSRPTPDKPTKPPLEAEPEQRKLTNLQAQRLAELSGVRADALSGLTVRDLHERFRFQIDPTLLFFRRVCGRVVRTDPVTGIEFPVPYATVHVEDTDCSLLGFFPANSPWAWYFPFNCRREVIATARTDECGEFCVLIPRWDIDWVLRFRRERICFPIIFERPSIRDLLERLIPRPIPFPFPEPDPEPFGPRPGPGPDPAPFSLADRAVLFQQLREQAGPNAADKLNLLESRLQLGAQSTDLSRFLSGPAFEQTLPPPLPAEFREQPSSARNVPEQGKEKAAKGKEPADDGEVFRSSLATRLNLDNQLLARLDPRAFIGPFKRCFDILIPEWVPLFDVPDITFRVTQDTNGDGDEETIYSEGYFQVRWNAGSIGPLTIEAWPNARVGLLCSEEEVPCDNVPAIVLAGRLPVTNAPDFYNASTGYAVRPNRPHPSGLFNDPLPNPPAESPFRGTVTLFGCLNTNSQATHYRVMYSYSSDGGASFGPDAPFVGQTWPLFRLGGGGTLEIHYPVADGNGWYPIALPSGPNPFLPQNVVLDWRTTSFANGRYRLRIQLGTGGSSVLEESAVVAFNVDNAHPSAPMTIEYRIGGGSFEPLIPPCPLVRRGTTPADVDFRVTLSAAARHLRSAYVAAGGCGGGGFDFIGGTGGALQTLSPSQEVYGHWHENPGDNNATLQAIFRLPASRPQGTYSFGAHVASRAFNPNGGDGGHLLVPPWEYNPAPIYVTPHFAFSVINANP